MRNQAALLGLKQAGLSPEGDLWRHAAVRPLDEHEAPLAEHQVPRTAGRDFSWVPVHGSAPERGHAETSCSLPPRRCPFGGACHTCPARIQAKRINNQPKDEYEQEAGRVPPIVREVLRSPGQPLDPATRVFMEPRFGHDFSQVRVHTGSKAAESARMVDALAYTMGRDVVFGPGQYAPGTAAGQRLLAHELTHVVQQMGRAHGDIAYRAIEDAPAASSGTTELLLAKIADMERVHAYASRRLAAIQSGETGGEAAEGGTMLDPANQDVLDRLEGKIDQLRTVANGPDEALKQRVLAAFSPPMLAQAEAQLQPEPRTAVRSGQGSALQVRQQTGERMAAMSITVSDPQDIAEAEANRIASAVTAGLPVDVRQAAPLSRMNRQVGEALTAAGATLLTAEAEAAPVEAGTGPPGWVVGGVILLVAAGLLAAGYLLTRAKPCPPCPASPAPEIDWVPPSTPHWPCPGDHWHFRVYNQNPETCECFLSGRQFGGCCGIPGAPC